MIKTKEDLLYYLEQDKINLKRKNQKKPNKNDIVWKYEIILRYYEYYHNKEHKSFIDKLKLKHYSKLHTKYTNMYTTSIPINVTGPGLSIAHLGAIYVNSRAKVGKNLRIQSSVVVGGEAKHPNKLPIIGDNVYLGTGAKVIGAIKIADDVAIGANCVVCKDILESGTTWAGVPAKKISDNNSHLYIAPELIGDDPIYNTVDESYYEDKDNC